MPRAVFLPLLPSLALALGGCAYGLAAGAIGSVANAASGGRSEAPADPAAASQACSARAGALGRVRIIDVVARGNGLRVFGAIEGGAQPLSFQCDFRGGRITGFETRRIRPRSS